MAALSGDVNRPKIRVSAERDEPSLLGGVAYNVYKGALVFATAANLPHFRNVNGTPAATDVFAGVAAEAKSVAASDASGAQKISVHIDGIHAFPKAAITTADIGKNVYATTDNDLQTLSTNALWVGIIKNVDATYVYVDITLAAGSVNVAK